MKNRFWLLKSFMAFTLAIFMGLGLFAMPVEAASKKKSGGGATYAEGDDIAFGHIDGVALQWTILSYDDSTKTALVISRNALNSKSIVEFRKAIAEAIKKSGKPVGYVRWSENYWRTFCNNILYKNCFTKEERDKIKKTSHSSEEEKNSILNLYHDTTLDGEYITYKEKQSLVMDVYDTQTTSSDYIFFLSSDEYTTYKDTMKYNGYSVWPLRTNYYGDASLGTFVREDTKLIYRGTYYYGDGIRPAMYVKLGEVEAEEAKTDSSSKDTSTAKTTDNTSKTTTAATNAKTSTATAATAASTSTTKTATAKKSGSYANNGTNIGNITLPDDSYYSLKAGGTAQVAIDMEYLNSTEKEYTITYKSSDGSVFTVDNTGKITGVSIGTGTLTVRMKKSNGKIYTMSCRIDVT